MEIREPTKKKKEVRQKEGILQLSSENSTTKEVLGTTVKSRLGGRGTALAIAKMK